MKSMRASVLLAIMFFCANIFNSIADAADIENGKIIFKRCVACHNADKPDNKIGPTLQHIFGRQAGTLEGYRFSPAMVKAGKEGLVWNRDTLINYLHSPQTMVKGTRMASIRLTKETDIDDLIAYLNSVSSSGNEQ